jgi:MSHA biogenesis protein MshM
MYLKHFAINKRPFDLTPNTEFSCNYRSHQEALNVLLFGIGNDEWIIKIIGDVGFGKTFLCRELLNCLAEPFVVVYLPNPDLNSLELKQAILRELQSKMPIDADPSRDLMQSLFEQLLHCQQQGKKVIAIIDEAQALPEESLEALRLLTNLETESKKLLQLVLFAQPEIKQRLARDSLRQLNQRITFSLELTPLEREEIGGYIERRLIVAGHRDGRLFSRAAQRLLHRASKGTPRLINILAHKAMLAAYGQGISKINRWAVKQAIKDSKDILPHYGYWSWGKIVLLSLFFITITAIAILFLIKYRM